MSAISVKNRIRKLRTDNKLTPEELGNIIGVQKASINKYEAGLVLPRLENILKLAKYFDTSPEYLMGWIDDPRKEPDLSNLKIDSMNSAESKVYIDLKSISVDVDVIESLRNTIENFKRSEEQYPILYKVPIVGSITAGNPNFIAEDIEGYEYVTEDEYKESSFYLRVKGNSMVDARICENDLVYVVSQDDVENGDIAVVIVNGDEATIKKVKKFEDYVILEPANKEYKPLMLTKKDNFRIIGKVMHVKFKV